MELVREWHILNRAKLTLWILLNLILAVLIAFERIQYPGSVNAWIVLKDLLTLNIGIYAISKAAFQTRVVKLWSLDGGDHLVGTPEGECRIDFLAEPFGPSPRHLTIRSAEVEIDPPVRTREVDEGQTFGEMRLRLLDKNGNDIDERDLELADGDRFSLLMTPERLANATTAIVSGQVLLEFNYAECTGKEILLRCTVPFKGVFGGMEGH